MEHPQASAGASANPSGGSNSLRQGRSPSQADPVVKSGNNVGTRVRDDGSIRIEPASSLRGDVAVPGDKSISHRAVLLGAVASGKSEVTGFGASEDTLATVEAVRALGVEVVVEGSRVLVDGVGLRGLRTSGKAIDCRNAGTLIRLLPGLLAGQEGRFELTGDASLSQRPLERIAVPLRLMGARADTTDGHAPLVVEGGPLASIRYELPVASAQVKSCLLFAGLYAEPGPTVVVEPVPARDHSERMLEAAGASIRRRAAEIAIRPATRLEPLSLAIPGDFSAAAPFLVAATLLPGSELRLHGVGINPTRTGLLAVLERMGARVSTYNRRRVGGEPVADLEVQAAELVATRIGAEEVPLLVDELPLFALAASFARGESVVTGAEELRVKESDRIESVTRALKPLGIRIRASNDGFRVSGVPSRPKGGGVVGSLGDHRIAMLGAVAGLVAREGVVVKGADSVAISFPDFFDALDTLRA